MSTYLEVKYTCEQTITRRTSSWISGSSMETLSVKNDHPLKVVVPETTASVKLKCDSCDHEFEVIVDSAEYFKVRCAKNGRFFMMIFLGIEALLLLGFFVATSMGAERGAAGFLAFAVILGIGGTLLWIISHFVGPPEGPNVSVNPSTTLSNPKAIKSDLLGSELVTSSSNHSIDVRGIKAVSESKE